MLCYKVCYCCISDSVSSFKIQDYAFLDHYSIARVRGLAYWLTPGMMVTEWRRQGGTGERPPPPKKKTNKKTQKISKGWGIKHPVIQQN